MAMMLLYSEQVWAVDSFLTPDDCHRLLLSIEGYRKTHALPQIHRPSRERSLRYSVINGRQIAESFPELLEIYRRLKPLAEEKSGLALDFMKNDLVGININITAPGGEYRWHYDRNAVTAILYLNTVLGGDTEVYPGYRFRLRNKHSRVQKLLDGLLLRPWLRRRLGKEFTFAPQAGKILLMRGEDCLHSVRAVQGSEDRINVIFSYERPGDRNPHEKELDAYLYTSEAAPESDPNYLA